MTIYIPDKTNSIMFQMLQAVYVCWYNVLKYNGSQCIKVHMFCLLRLCSNALAQFSFSAPTKDIPRIVYYTNAV